MWGGHAWRARGAPAYNGVWGQNPTKVQGQSPRSEGQGATPPLKMKTF